MKQCMFLWMGNGSDAIMKQTTLKLKRRDLLCEAKHVQKVL